MNELNDGNPGKFIIVEWGNWEKYIQEYLQGLDDVSCIALG